MIRARISSWIPVGVILAVILGNPAQAKIVEVVLDASGSMAGALPDGRSKLEAAKNAVRQVLGGLPDDVTLAFRAYGHQSATEKRDCKDTALIVPFAPAGENRQKLEAALPGLTARGYTPITHVIETAAKDFPQDAKDEKILVLVSDGKETCAGDPCAAAAALAKSGAALVIHAVGFDVDATAKAQLECVARATGGTYSDAADANALVQALGQAVSRGAPPKKTVIALPRTDPGILMVEGADLKGHTVTEAESGKQVASLSHVKGSVSLPPGIYNVTVGKGVWKSVEIRPGERTILKPARIGVEHATINGHKILDPETGEVMGSVSATGSSTAVMPGRYLVCFGEARWPVELGEGQNLTLRPGVVSGSGLDVNGLAIFAADGTKVGGISASRSSFPLPPGEYYVEVNKQKVPFTLGEGDMVELQ